MLTKSNLMSWRQCPRRLWLEWHRKDLIPEPDTSADRRAIDGQKVGEKARADLGADLVWPARNDDLGVAVAQAVAQLLASPGRPAVEMPMAHDELYARADALVPMESGYALRETKASTFPLRSDEVTPAAPEDAHLDDIAIQAWVMESLGVPMARAELNLLNNRWRYPGNGDYSGLFRQYDVTELISERREEVPNWYQAARAVVDGSIPPAVTGKHCNDPYDCRFVDHCKGLEPPPPEHPIELLPDTAGKNLARRLKEAKGYVSILEPDAEELAGKQAELYRRIQAAHQDGATHLSPAAKAVLAGLPYPRYYFDFEGIDMPVPRWAGVRPYEQVPFQWSCHVERVLGQFEHVEFLDLSGNDPSLACIEAMRHAIDPADDGPIFVYAATYEKGRLRGLAARHPEHAALMERYVDRIFDLHPVVKDNLYDARMRGSFSIKKVLPVMAPDLLYEELDEVQEGTGAQVAYMRAVFDDLPPERVAEIDRRLRQYCRQDTWAMVELAHFLARAPRPIRPREDE